MQNLQLHIHPRLQRIMLEGSGPGAHLEQGPPHVSWGDTGWMGLGPAGLLDAGFILAMELRDEDEACFEGL